MINITKGEKVFSWRELVRSSDVIYNWGYGNWEDPLEMNDITFVFYLHTTVFIGLVMFNLLIAIISGTFEEFTEDRIMVDLEEILDMLTEMATFLNVVRSIRMKFFGWGGGELTFYHFLVPDESEEDLKEIQSRLESLEAGQAEMREEMRENQMKVEEGQRQMTELLMKLVEAK